MQCTVSQLSSITFHNAVNLRCHQALGACLEQRREKCWLYSLVHSNSWGVVKNRLLICIFTAPATAHLKSNMAAEWGLYTCYGRNALQAQSTWHVVFDRQQCLSYLPITFNNQLEVVAPCYLNSKSPFRWKKQAFRRQHFRLTNTCRLPLKRFGPG